MNQRPDLDSAHIAATEPPAAAAAIRSARRRRSGGAAETDLRIRACALRDCGKSRHRHRLRLVPADRALRDIRALDRALRSAGERHARSFAGAVGEALVRYRPARARHLEPGDGGGAARHVYRGGSVALVFALGGLSGTAAGFFGGWTDRIVGRIADTIMAFPLFVLAMGIVAALGNTVTNIVIATAIINYPLYARVARAEANVRREAGFVQAARLSGNGEFRILLTQILPNIMPIMVVQMSLTMGYAILNAAGLSFIGLGVRPPTPEWGIMVAEGAGFIVSGEWWIAFFPGAALMLAVFCFNLLGDGLRDIVDPQRRT